MSRLQKPSGHSIWSTAWEGNIEGLSICTQLHALEQVKGLMFKLQICDSQGLLYRVCYLLRCLHRVCQSCDSQYAAPCCYQFAF